MCFNPAFASGSLMPYKSSPSTPEASFSRLPPSLGALAIMALTLKLPLAALLAIFWFSTRSNENVPATAINTQSIQPSQPTAPAVTAPAEAPAATQTASVPMNTAQNNNAVAPHPVSHKAIAPEQTPDLTNTSVAEAVTPVTKNPAPAPIEEADPAAVMASHRFAKMIKSTQTVVVSQQDKL